MKEIRSTERRGGGGGILLTLKPCSNITFKIINLKLKDEFNY